MISGYVAEEVRAAEAPFLASGEPLMERAAMAITLAAVRLLRGPGSGHPLERRHVVVAQRRSTVAGSTVLVLAGAGNNGGDALWAGASLARRGVRVVALLTAERHHVTAASALSHAGGRIERLTSDNAESWASRAAAVDLIIDGVLGTGAVASPGLRGPVRQVVLALGRRAAGGVRRPRMLAVDLPSGVQVDDGTVPDPEATVRADATVTLGAMKAGLLLDPAAAFAGTVEVADIGISGPLASREPRVRRLGAGDLRRLGLLAEPARDSQKYRRGVLGLVAGTNAFPGAAVLAASGAAGMGAGMVRYLGPWRVARAVLAQRPEVVAVGGQVQAWAIGSGCGPWDEAAITRAQAAQLSGMGALPAASHPVDEQLAHALHAIAQAVGSPGTGLAEAATPVPTVVDAGALALLPRRVPATVVLTPHAGELARLLTTHGLDVTRDAVEAEPWRWAREAHELTGATVLLKGAITVVVGPDGCWSQQDGTAWLASAGSGDVLAGILGSLLAQHAEEVLADPARTASVAAAAALIHGRAGRRASQGGPLPALAVAHAVAPTVADLLRSH